VHALRFIMPNMFKLSIRHQRAVRIPWTPALVPKCPEPRIDVSNS